MSTFFEDVKTVRPTAMMIIPRIANMIYDQAQEKIRKVKGTDKQVVLPSHSVHQTDTSSCMIAACLPSMYCNGDAIWSPQMGWCACCRQCWRTL